MPSQIKKQWLICSPGHAGTVLAAGGLQSHNCTRTTSWGMPWLCQCCSVPMACLHPLDVIKQQKGNRADYTCSIYGLPSRTALLILS